MGRSRGGVTTKIHALVAAECRPIHLKLTERQAHDVRSAADMFDTVEAGHILGSAMVHLTAAGPGRDRTRGDGLHEEGRLGKGRRRAVAWRRARPQGADQQGGLAAAGDAGAAADRIEAAPLQRAADLGVDQTRRADRRPAIDGEPRHPRLGAGVERGGRHEHGGEADERQQPFDLGGDIGPRRAGDLLWRG